MACKTLNEAVHNLYHSLRDGKADNFSALLFRLITKADADNKVRLAIAFPNEFAAWYEWQKSPNEQEFFQSHGIGLDKKK